MYPASIHILKELLLLLQQEQIQKTYSQPVAILSNGTIGQHVRHIVELYTSLLDGYDLDLVNYDSRKRELLLETNAVAAAERIESIIERIDKADKLLVLKTLLSEKEITIHTSYYRELFYNLEHCIHHQALIRAALIASGLHIVSENFGVAPSTQQYRKQCVQ